MSLGTETILQLGVGGIFSLQVLKLVFEFVGKQRYKQRANGHDFPGASCQLNTATLVKLVEALETNTKAIRQLLEHEDDEKRILYRVEKQLDKFEN